MTNDERVAVLQRGAAAWSAWRAEHGETPDLSRTSLRGLDLSGFDLSQADLRQADLRGTNLSQANLSRARLDGVNFFKAVLDGADLAGAFLYEAQFLNCAQLVVTRNWQFDDQAIRLRAAYQLVESARIEKDETRWTAFGDRPELPRADDHCGTGPAIAAASANG